MSPHRAMKKNGAFMKLAIFLKLEKIKVKTFGTDINNEKFAHSLVEGKKKH
jgi:hypothetical protein